MCILAEQPCLAWQVVWRGSLCGGVHRRPCVALAGSATGRLPAWLWGDLQDSGERLRVARGHANNMQTAAHARGLCRVLGGKSCQQVVFCPHVGEIGGAVAWHIGCCGGIVWPPRAPQRYLTSAHRYQHTSLVVQPITTCANAWWCRRQRRPRMWLAVVGWLGPALCFAVGF